LSRSESKRCGALRRVKVALTRVACVATLLDDFQPPPLAERPPMRDGAEVLIVGMIP